MALEHYTTSVEDAVALFIDQYKEKPRLAALLATYTKSIQAAEDALWDVYFSHLIDNAEGIQLDVIGKLVGQSRIGTDDAGYRIFIRTRIRANRSRGRPDDIISVATLALDGLRFDYIETYPASFVVDVLDPLTSYAQFIHDIIASAKPVGVGFSLHYSLDEEDETFAFSPDDVEFEDEFRGMSDELVDASGGTLITVL